METIIFFICTTFRSGEGGRVVYQKIGEERFQIFNTTHMETERGEKTISIFEVLPFLPYSSIVPHPITSGYVQVILK